MKVITSATTKRHQVVIGLARDVLVFSTVTSRSNISRDNEAGEGNLRPDHIWDARKPVTTGCRFNPPQVSTRIQRCTNFVFESA
jgi:hypothetical protein